MADELNDIQKLIKKAGGVPAFIELTGVPRRTAYAWNQGVGKPPEWSLKMIRFWLQYEPEGGR